MKNTGRIIIMLRSVISFTLSFLLAFIDFIPPRLSHAQEIEEYNIAVLDLTAKGISEVETDYLSEYMRGQVTRLVTSEEYIKTSNIIYTVVERSQMDKIFEQFEIQNLGCTDVSCAIELGKMLNVEKIIIGSVGLVGKTYSISIRIVDIETAKTTAVADYVFTGQRDNLLTEGIPSVVNELMYGKKQKKSRKKLYYILAGVVLTAGIAAVLLIPDEKKDDAGTISIKIPVP